MKPESRVSFPTTLEPSSRRFGEWMAMQYSLIRPVDIYTSELQVLSSDDGLPQKLSSLFCVSNAVLPHSHCNSLVLESRLPKLESQGSRFWEIAVRTETIFGIRASTENNLR